MVDRLCGIAIAAVVFVRNVGQIGSYISCVVIDFVSKGWISSRIGLLQILAKPMPALTW